jgi:predicted esterase
MSEDFIHEFVPGRIPTTLLLLHGTGGNEQSMLPIGESLLPGAALLSPRGKILENGMPRFFRRLAEGVFDIDDLIARSNELAEWIGKAAVRYGFDLASVVAIGYSNGANIAASMLLLGAAKFPVAILFRPMVPLVPGKPANLVGSGIFISAGTHDPICPPEQTKHLAELLENAGAKVTTHLEESGHNLTSAEFPLAARWLATAALLTSG